MCLDWDQEIVLKPNYLAYITISLIPCDYAPDYYGFEDDGECIADKEQQKAYLDNTEAKSYLTHLYYNYETFESEQYGE